MRPWQHARSSAGKSRSWTDDLAIHEFMDSTKVACADLRHRMILHNRDLGPDCASLIFADRLDARDIALRHVEEDLGFCPTLQDYMDDCDLARLPRVLLRRRHIPLVDVADRLAEQHGLVDVQPARQVLDVLLKPAELAGPEALPVLFNSYGPELVRRVLGGPTTLAAKTDRIIIFDPAHLAEALIHWVFGRIPPVSEIVLAQRSIPVWRKPAQ